MLLKSTSSGGPFFCYDKEGYGFLAIVSSIEAAFLFVVCVLGDVCFLSLQCTAWPIATQWIPVSFLTTYQKILDQDKKSRSGK